VSGGRPPAPRDPVERLPVAGAMQLREVLQLLAHDRRAPTTVRDPEEAWRTHVVDSLTGLEVPELRAAKRIADVGSGAGFPGLALAAALPDSHVDLIESAHRKCEFMRLAAERARIDNVHVVCERAETWSAATPPGGGRESCDAVTARAVGRLSTLAELASPLLAGGGLLVAWKGRRDPEEEAEAQGAAERLAMAPGPVLAVGELAGFEHRHLYVFRKEGPTPAGLPRKPGMAKKRPLGADL
jgi:16S rRNA (guanine527-N7)-methyltransferase